MEHVANIELMTERRNNELSDVFRKEEKKLFGFIRSRVPSDEDAEDILQDVFYGLLDIAEPIVQINSWLFRVAKNKIYDRYRKKKTLSSEALGLEDEDRWLDSFDFEMNEGEERMQAQEILDHVFHAVDQLPDNQRDVFIMHEIEELSFAEISELLNVNQNTLLSRKRYAIQSLRKQLSNYYEEFKN